MGVRRARRTGAEALSLGRSPVSERPDMHGAGTTGPSRWSPPSPTASAFTTCARTCTNGAATGTTRATTPSRRRRIRTGPPRARAALRAEGPGGITSKSRAAPPAAAFRRIPLCGLRLPHSRVDASACQSEPLLPSISAGWHSSQTRCQSPISPSLRNWLTGSDLPNTVNPLPLNHSLRGQSEITFSPKPVTNSQEIFRPFPLNRLTRELPSVIREFQTLLIPWSHRGPHRKEAPVFISKEKYHDARAT